ATPGTSSKRKSRTTTVCAAARGCICAAAVPASTPAASSALTQHDARIGNVALEGKTGQALEGLDIARARAGDDLGRQGGAGIGLAPAQRLAIVAHELLVERRRIAARCPRISRPEARGIRRGGLVAQHQRLAVEAELELGVGDDDAARRGVLRD